MWILSLLLSTMPCSTGRCRDTDIRCFLLDGRRGWYADLCVASRQDVLNACRYMCGECEHEAYRDSVLYYDFNQLNGTKFNERYGGQSEDVGVGVSVYPRGRVLGMLFLNQSACLTLGNFSGTCVSDPGLCVTTGLTLSFFFDYSLAPQRSIADFTVFTSGSHSSSRGISFYYKDALNRFFVTLKTGDQEYTVEFENADVQFQGQAVTHFAITWNRAQGLKLYGSGILLRSTTTSSPVYISDNYTQLRIGCQQPSDIWGQWIKLDEFVVWSRILSLDEIRSIASNHDTDDPFQWTHLQSRLFPVPSMLHNWFIKGRATAADNSHQRTSTGQTLGQINYLLSKPLNVSEFMSVLRIFQKTITDTVLTGADVKETNAILSHFVSPGNILRPIPHDVSGDIVSKVSDIVDVLLNQSNHAAWNAYSKNTPGALPNLLDSVDSFFGMVTEDILLQNKPIYIREKRDNFDVRLVSSVSRQMLFELDDGDVVELQRPSTDTAALVVQVFKGIGKIFPTVNNATFPSMNNQSQNVTLRISDHIVGVTLLSGNHTDNTTIVLTFHYNIDNASDVFPRCVFLHYIGSLRTSNMRHAYWTDDSCTTDVDVTNNNITCTCRHLTNFAILMNVVDVEMNRRDREALEVITYIGCSLSILGAFLAVITFILLGSYTERIIIHLNLAIAIIGAQILLLVEEGVTRATPACTAVTILLYYFNMAIFSWMLLEGIHLFLQTVIVFASNPRIKQYYAFGWGVPAIIVIIAVCILHDSLGKHDVCWLTPVDNSIWAFAVPALLVVCTNILILVSVLNVVLTLSANMEENKLRKIRIAARSSILLLPLLGTGWLFGVLTVSRRTVVFQYIFAAVNSSQGMLLFICHCVYNTEIRQMFVSKTSHWDLTRQLRTHRRIDPLSNNRHRHVFSEGRTTTCGGDITSI